MPDENLKLTKDEKESLKSEETSKNVWATTNDYAEKEAKELAKEIERIEEELRKKSG